MSFLHDALFSRRYHHASKDEQTDTRGLRRASGNAGLLSPLAKLVRDPAGTIEDFVGALGGQECQNLPELEDGSRKQILYLRLQNAENYTDWHAAASEIDDLEGNNDWKHEHESSEYNYELVEARLKQLDDARISCDVQRMLFLIRTSLTRGLGGMGDLRLYKHSHVGTKALIERYIESAKQTLTALLDISSKQGDSGLDPRYVLEQLLATRQSFGRSALLLSGGGTFGMNHIGVIKSLWETDLLPRIISGASAGSIVCAVLCTRTDTEMPQVLDEFCYGDLDVFEKPGDRGLLTKAARFLKYGAVFDISHLIQVMRNMLGDMTFQEAYNRTRRILNITVSSASAFDLPRLLNYITAPNVIIWSAVAASCSVPLVFSAAQLMAKDPTTGQQIPWDPSPQRWIDGSVDNDLPITRLAEMFNVNHFIVSQVNPHVVPFLEKEEGVPFPEAQTNASAFAAGPGWLHSMANLAKGEAQHRLHVIAELGFFPNYCTKARSILSQRYSGDITIFPAISYSQFPRILSNPTPEFMKQAMICGERATWPKMSRIINHCAIELALDDAVRQLRARVVFSPSEVDLRKNLTTRPSSVHSESGRGRGRTLRCRQDLTRSINDLDQAARHGRPTSLHLDVPVKYRTRSRPELRTAAAPRASDSALLQVPTQDILSSATEEDLISTDSEDDNASLSSLDSPPDDDQDEWPPYLFPSISQPATPNHSSRSLRSTSATQLAMTKTPSAVTQPSSPERIYKRLFHAPQKTTQSTKTPESPQSGSNKPNEGRRRESHSGLHTDISGTRGMLLRRKKSFGSLLPSRLQRKSKKTTETLDYPTESDLS
ncbi:nte family protein [Diplodia corticola]|uniref:Patatin-like phospholipase domain-containing protein n=1 Tax=Diplodia corticola TaxID=236234 RepID=A0A1J9RVY5_9PEZI|nr:nte family protein [Diplodia corticola]OJD36779.1 nte family protein [Diplodia corticola]